MCNQGNQVNQFGLYLDKLCILRFRGRINSNSLGLGATYNRHYINLLILQVYRKLKPDLLLAPLILGNTSHY